jgi:4-diphosphocytidyl-2-C-methyl-D-erythritol kinase
MAHSVFVQAPAKVNLALAVGPVEPETGDPRHPICSWMVPIDFYDDLTVTALDPGYFSRYAIIWAEDAKRKTDIDWPITKDLAVKAHLLLEEEFGRRMPTQLKLEKRIPVGSGLGGGSSDAAAMLIACNRLHGLDLAVDELLGFAARLGSDVPFFVDAASAIVEGFGERMSEAADVADLQLAVFMPECSCSTADVYRSFDSVLNDGAIDPNGFAERAAIVRELATSPILDPDSPFNDLAQPAVSNHPALQKSLDCIQELSDRKVHITGSGAAMFVVCDNSLHAEHLVKAVVDQHGLAGVVAGFHRLPPSGR